MFSFFSSQAAEQAADAADREAAILRALTVAPCARYNAQPSFAQFASFVQAAETHGYTITRLYELFSAGTFEPVLDALFRAYAPRWPQIP